MRKKINYKLITDRLLNTYDKFVDIAREADVHTSLITKVNRGELQSARCWFDGEYPIRLSNVDRNAEIVREKEQGMSVVDLQSKYNLSQVVIHKVLRSAGFSRIGQTWYNAEDVKRIRGER